MNDHDSPDDLRARIEALRARIVRDAAARAAAHPKIEAQLAALLAQSKETGAMLQALLVVEERRASRLGGPENPSGA